MFMIAASLESVLLRRLLVVICSVAFLFWGESGAWANSVKLPGEESSSTVWNLEADKLNTLGDNTIVEAEGGVVLKRGNDILKADFARYYSTTNWVYLRGNVFVRMGRDDINADEAEFDLRSKTGWLTNGHVFMAGPHIYFSGSRIVKHWGDRYTFNKAKVTTCDGETPAWSMNAEQAVVEIDGYAQLFHSSFDVKDVGVFYTPFMVLPAKTTRQSGFLMPDYGISEKRGFYYTQPYFWAIDESHDMTIYGGLMSKIGPLFSLEYRSHEFTGQKTWLAATGIYDRDRVTSPGTGRVENSSYARTNHDRYWLRGMTDGFLGASTWRYRANIDFVSDQDYLREFNQGPVGFDRTRDTLFQMFGRDLQEDDQNRVSAGLISNDWQRVGVVASMRYEQDPSLGHGNRRSRSQDQLVQRLPQLDMFLYKGRILPDFPLEVEAQFQSAYMYRAEGTTGWRSELYPRVSLPLNLGYGSLIGTMGLRQTYYNTSRADYTSPRALYQDNSRTSPRQTGESRTMVDWDIQGYTEASRVWQLGDGEELAAIPENAGKQTWTAVRHEIQPRIRYSMTPRVDQEKNPFYTTDDRILPTNELTYSITNIITRKGERVTVKGEGNQREASRSAFYQDLLRWRIESGYDFDEAERDRYLDKYERRPFMDILSDFEIYPWPWLGYNGKTYISPYDGEITRHDHNLNLRYKDKVSFYTGISFRDKYYDYRKKFKYEDWRDVGLTSRVELVHNMLTVNLTPEWSIYIDDYRNMREGGSLGKAYDQSINIAYTAQCYRIVGRYRYDGYDKSYSVLVEIPGLFE